MRDTHALCPAKRLPNGFGDEWREWMKHDKDVFERALEKVGIFPKFFAFEEPVGVFVPDEIVDSVTCLGEAIFAEEALDFFVSSVDFAADPVFAKIVYDYVFILGLGIVDHILNEACDVPNLVAEVAACDDFAATEGLVDAGAAASDEAEAQSIGTVLCDDFDRIDNVALGLGHLLAFFI